MQSLANSPAVNVPIDAITLQVPLNQVAADHTVTKTTAPKDITVDKKLDAQSEKENQMILPLEKVSSCDPGYLGPYRSQPNFTQGKKLSTVAAKSIPHSTYVDSVQSSIQNDQIVVVKKKVNKRIDRSQPKVVRKHIQTQMKEGEKTKEKNQNREESQRKGSRHEKA